MTDGNAARPDGENERLSESATANEANAQGIFAGEFEVYRTVTESDYQAVLTSGLIVLDTSALLDLYRYHAKTRQELIQVLDSLRGRVWVPNHAMHEFFKNRLGAIDGHGRELTKAINDLNGYSTTFSEAIAAWVNRVSLPPEQRQELFDQDLKPILAEISSLISKIQLVSSDPSFKDASDTARDPVIGALDEILSGSIGEPMADGELLEVKKTARERIQKKIPPGWKDADKEENPEGDYIIWYQTLQEAKQRGLDVLFVTSDLKEDWWRKERGELKGPLPELVREMRAVASVRLYMLRPASLLAHAGTALGVEVSDESVQDAERVSRSVASEMLAAFAGEIFLSRAGNSRQRPFLPRWRYTSNGFDLGSVANLSQRSFSHPSYMLAYDKRLPAFRVGTFVACDSLSGDDITADYLRSQMRAVLGQHDLLGFISRITRAHVDAQWHSQPGRGRFTLEADVMSPDIPDIPAASALLLMPESDLGGYGRNQDGAELYLHVNLPVKANKDGSVDPESFSLTEWYQRFMSALVVPEILAQFLESVGLAAHDEPRAKFAMQIQGRTVDQLGIEELVDFGGLEALTPLRHSVQFDGWAVADPDGKPAGALAKRFLIELCESVGRTGYDNLIAQLPD